MRRVLVTTLAAVPVGAVFGASVQAADHVEHVLRWPGALGAPWLAVAFALGAVARQRIAGAAGGAAALVTGTVAWYALHPAAPHVVAAWALIAVVAGAGFGALGAHWRASHRWPVALLAGAFAGEALVLAQEWPRAVTETVLLAELTVAAALPLLLVRPARALPAVLALTAVAALAMGAAADEVREAARAAGWRGL